MGVHRRSCHAVPGKEVNIRGKARELFARANPSVGGWVKCYRLLVIGREADHGYVDTGSTKNLASDIANLSRNIFREEGLSAGA
jgi:hypothetical protein